MDNFNKFMTKQTITQSQKRFQESLSSLFSSEDSTEANFLFLKSSTDVGVERNGGRNGARLAPRSLLSYIKKLNICPSLENKIFKEVEVSCEISERADFREAQAAEARSIAPLVKNLEKTLLCHLGGGHDHIYPLLTALSQKYQKIIVINIDAHADTRVDLESHSGTPFRQFSEEFSGGFHLFQIGLHEFANSKSTLSSLEKTKSHTLWRKDLKDHEKTVNYFKEIKKVVDEKSVVVFSLDADALHGADMPGVSAVNGDGITLVELHSLWGHYQALPKSHQPLLGIYELNPVYDSVSMLSMRTVGAFLYQCFEF
jgi:formiminoglutamase